ncbi:hypothetical protein A2Z41_00835 [Microgenomates group bacterium RBG_19FT_COMBO_39_10]|nr:MAG: hypothetical protein A2Z41_00835 [Microgenomates group bacterium RBG_19FT_COMBO_39_10]
MEILSGLIPFQLSLVEWGRFILWMGMLSTTVLAIKPINMLSKALTASIFMITRLGGKDSGDRLRVGSRIGFDIDRTYLDEVITILAVIGLFLVILNMTGERFPNRIPFR